MPANISFNANTGKYEFWAARQAAWHGLGQVTPDAKRWEDAIVLAGLNWDVVKLPLSDPWGNEVAAGMFRSDNNRFMGSVGAGYTPIQNRQCFEFVDSIIDAESGAIYESAGALMGGKRVWCLARIPGLDFAPVPGDHHETYLLFTTGHDGGEAAQVKVTTVRVVCQNTLGVALRGTDDLRIRHTRGAVGRMEAAKALLTTAARSVSDVKSRLQLLSGRVVTRDAFINVLDRLFPKKDDQEEISSRRKATLENIATLFEWNDNGQIQGTAGTAYGLFNSITEYTDHFRSAKGSKYGYTPEQARAASAMFGTGADFKAEALRVVLDATKDCPAAPTATDKLGSLDNILNMVSIN